MKIIFFNYAYYFQTMAQKVSEKQTKESAMFDRLREVEKQKILNLGLTPDQQEAVIDEVIAFFKLKKQYVMPEGRLYSFNLESFENDCINTIKSLDQQLIIDRVVRNSR